MFATVNSEDDITEVAFEAPASPGGLEARATVELVGANVPIVRFNITYSIVVPPSVKAF